jgi:hypothetical protein
MLVCLTRQPLQLVDEAAVQRSDVAANFLLSPESVGRNRAESCL